MSSPECRLDLTGQSLFWFVSDRPEGETSRDGFWDRGYFLRFRPPVQRWCEEQGITYVIAQYDRRYWYERMGGLNKDPVAFIVDFDRPEYRVMFLMRWRGVNPLAEG